MVEQDSSASVDDDPSLRRHDLKRARAHKLWGLGDLNGYKDKKKQIHAEFFLLLAGNGFFRHLQKFIDWLCLQILTGPQPDGYGSLLLFPITNHQHVGNLL